MKDILKKSYNKSAHLYDNNFTKLQFPKYQLLLNGYTEILKNISSILDLGCGTGLLYDYFRQESLCCDSLVGIDFADEMITLAQKKGMNVICQDISILPFENNTLDCVLSFTVLKILDDDETDVLNEVKRVLKPGGYFFVSILKKKDTHYMYKTTLETVGFTVLEMRDCSQDHGYICRNT